MNPGTVSRSQRYLALAGAFLPPKVGSPPELILAYTRLFLGPGRPAVHLYESVYTEGRMMGAATLKVAECYAAAGLQIDAIENEIPDHISTELTFMANLAEREEQDEAQPKRWRDHQRRFLNEHLGRWLPLFVERLEKSRVHPFYYEAALAMKKMIDHELQRLNLSSDEIDLEDFKRPQSQASPLTAVPAPSVHKRSQQYPNIQVEVNALNCTLCTLCADICETGALTIARSPQMLSLIFDPKTCNGCRACLRNCPEKAVSIVRGSPLATPTTRLGSVVAKAKRIICPSCKQPHISTSWFTRLVGRLEGDENTHHLLTYCPYCKASPATVQAVPKRSSEESFDNA